MLEGSASRLHRRIGRPPAVAWLLLVVAACGMRPTGPTAAPDAEPFLDDLEQRTFGFFWDLANPANGLVPDRWPTESFSSVAAVGFGLTAYPIGAERGYVTRAQAGRRALTTLRFLWTAPQGPEATGVTGHNGFFYHFLDMQTGRRFEKVELSTIDTALMLAGALVCMEYFDRADSVEVSVRAYADSLYRRVDWRWATPRPPLVAMGWTPENGFHQWDWRGYNEAMLLYVLALGSPTHAIDAAAWDAYHSTDTWGDFHGQAHFNFGPLFGHQYSQIWIDFRGIRDATTRARGIDWFENSRRAVLSQRAYAIANPGGWIGYGADLWGLSASDGPLDTTLQLAGRERRFHTYWARGAALTETTDDGTLAPTALGGSIPFAPDITIGTLRKMRDRYGEPLYGKYGFLDAFNPTFTADVRVQHGRVVPGVAWFDTDYLGIDQGPIIAMVENYRSDMVWRLVRGNRYVIEGLRRAGFAGGWIDTAAAR